MEDDERLVVRCLEGDQAAWEALVLRYERLLYAIVRRIGLDDHGAADVFQTVFGRLITHLPSLREPARLKAWLVTSCKREALRIRAQASRNVSTTSDAADDGTAVEWDLPDESLLPDEALESLQAQDSVRAGLARLDERCRLLLTLLFQDDADASAYDEVARRLAMPIGSIGPTRSRCLAKLRGLMK